jgi:hypothetical protein
MTRIWIKSFANQQGLPDISLPITAISRVRSETHRPKLLELVGRPLQPDAHCGILHRCEESPLRSGAIVFGPLTKNVALNQSNSMKSQNSCPKRKIRMNGKLHPPTPEKWPKSGQSPSTLVR